MQAEDFDPVAYINEPRWQQARLGLDRIRELLKRLGRPQDRLRFVHVAGTNGKGSTCAYLASILRAAGYRTGQFSSPFIERFEERIRVDGRDISPDQLREVTLAVRVEAEAMAAATGDHPTEFELMTAVALEHFARQRCDIVVLEVGLGGRLDSTNVIDAPDVAVIARIGLDHTAILGDTLAAIAQEKAGIVKAGSAVVSWPQEPEAMQVIERAAAACGDVLTVPDLAQLHVGGVRAAVAGEGAVAAAAVSAGGVPDAVEAAVDAGGTSHAAACPTSPCVPMRAFSYQGQAFETRLLGSYQPENAAVSIEAAYALRACGWRIPDEAVHEGIARAEWPARFEVLPRIAGKPQVVVDGGHNPQGARALAASLADVFPHRAPVLVMSVMADKDYPAMLDAVLPLARAFVACAPAGNPRALAPEALADAARAAMARRAACEDAARAAAAESASTSTSSATCTAASAAFAACVDTATPTPNPCPVYSVPDFDQAVARAAELAGADGLICAFGSLYSVSGMKKALRRAGLIR